MNEENKHLGPKFVIQQNTYSHQDNQKKPQIKPVLLANILKKNKEPLRPVKTDTKLVKMRAPLSSKTATQPIKVVPSSKVIKEVK